MFYTFRLNYVEMERQLSEANLELDVSRNQVDSLTQLKERINHQKSVLTSEKETLE